MADAVRTLLRGAPTRALDLALQKSEGERGPAPLLEDPEGDDYGELRTEQSGGLRRFDRAERVTAALEATLSLRTRTDLLSSATMQSEGFELLSGIPCPLSQAQIDQLFGLLAKTDSAGQVDLSRGIPMRKAMLAKQEAKILANLLEILKRYAETLVFKSRQTMRGEGVGGYSALLRWAKNSQGVFSGTSKLHEDGYVYITLTVALKGKGTFVRILGGEVAAPPLTPLLMTGQKRTDRTDIPATLHRAPTYRTDEPRLVLLILF